ncbi:MAG: ABC transporter permease [Halobacteriaceae archaeon]
MGTPIQRLAVRLRAVAGLAAAQLTATPGWTALAVAGVALAVLSTTLLAGVGFGVVETGEQKFAAADRDLWVTGGPVRLAPASVGGFENPIRDAHNLSASLQDRDDVRTAVPMSFQTVYVGTEPDPDRLRTVLAVGIPSAGGIRVTNGSGFSRPDAHYAGGSYSGPVTGEVIVGPRVADQFGVGVGDTLYVGGTVVGAVRNNGTVVGVSPTLARFLGAPTVVVPLAELQTMTGTAYADSATLITVALADGADPAAVEADIEARHPGLEVRTNREQLRRVVASKALVVASGGVLVVLAFVAGLALLVNLVALLVHQQRHALAALRAVGVSTPTVVGMMAGQGLFLGVVGGGLGLALTPPAAALLDAVAVRLVGFEGLVRTPALVYVVGAVGAAVLGAASAAVAATRVAALDPLSVLRER